MPVTRCHTLQPTALVHEGNLRLVGGEQAQTWDNRRHFFAAVAEAMRFTAEQTERKAFLMEIPAAQRSRPLLKQLLHAAQVICESLPFRQGMAGTTATHCDVVDSWIGQLNAARHLVADERVLVVHEYCVAGPQLDREPQPFLAGR